MQVRWQRCHACDATQFEELLSGKSDGLPVVYVRCASCGALVARYELSGYYRHGEGVESLLRSHDAAAGDSGRRWLAELKEVRQETVRGYEEALARLEAQDENDATH
jgi:hypothetical protein